MTRNEESGVVLTLTHECDDLRVVKSNGSGNVMPYKDVRLVLLEADCWYE